MKNYKISLFFTAVLISLSTFSCSNKSNITNSDCFISEYFVGSFFYNSAIEITNNSNKDIEAINYHLDIFDGENIYKTIKLNSVIPSKNSIVFVNKEFDSTLLDDENINIIFLDDNYLTGDRYIELKNEKGKLLDCIGHKGFNISYVNSTSLVKLRNIL